jgi:hypothetical protein
MKATRRGWAAAFEAALAGLLARTPAGDDDDASVVWFADAWAPKAGTCSAAPPGCPTPGGRRTSPTRAATSPPLTPPMASKH